MFRKIPAFLLTLTLAFSFIFSKAHARDPRDEQTLRVLRSTIQTLEEDVKNCPHIERVDGVLYKINRGIFYGTALASTAITATVFGVWQAAAVAEIAERAGYKRVEGLAQKVTNRLAYPAEKLRNWTIVTLTAFLASHYIDSWAEDTTEINEQEMQELHEKISNLKEQVRQIESRLESPLSVDLE